MCKTPKESAREAEWSHSHTQKKNGRGDRGGNSLSPDLFVGPVCETLLGQGKRAYTQVGRIFFLTISGRNSEKQLRCFRGENDETDLMRRNSKPKSQKKRPDQKRRIFIHKIQSRKSFPNPFSPRISFFSFLNFKLPALRTLSSEAFQTASHFFLCLFRPSSGRSSLPRHNQLGSVRGVPAREREGGVRQG